MLKFKACRSGLAGSLLVLSKFSNKHQEDQDYQCTGTQLDRPTPETLSGRSGRRQATVGVPSWTGRSQKHCKEDQAGDRRQSVYPAGLADPRNIVRKIRQETGDSRCTQLDRPTPETFWTGRSQKHCKEDQAGDRRQSVYPAGQADPRNIVRKIGQETGDSRCTQLDRPTPETL
ncbi:hypothetical protein RRG08_009260 [Elysia crispata]|uniref:Uncharacterized protein n=1 Tax=Elysia crispata TaxID=231223 RepID=A0AAE1E872_9GAST|nr:hypothetical protein RRG08_009260 [Elysia crispata]